MKTAHWRLSPRLMSRDWRWRLRIDDIICRYTLSQPRCCIAPSSPEAEPISPCWTLHDQSSHHHEYHTSNPTPPGSQTSRQLDKNAGSVGRELRCGRLWGSEGSLMVPVGEAIQWVAVGFEPCQKKNLPLSLTLMTARHTRPAKASGGEDMHG